MDSISNFLGSFWFGVMLAALGYIAGNLIPLSIVAKWIPTKKD